MRTLIIIAAMALIAGCSTITREDYIRGVGIKESVMMPSYRAVPVVMPPIIIYQQPMRRLDAGTPGSGYYQATQPNRSMINNYMPCIGARCF